MTAPKRIKKRGVALLSFVIGGMSGFYLRDVCHRDTPTFIGQWITHPTEVGALTPCSEYVVEEIVRPITSSQKQRLRVLEVGSGPGVVTEKIVAALSGKDYHLDLVEINDEFVRLLKNRYSLNPHITIHHADITSWKPDGQYDVIVSTLPFNIFSKDTIQEILTSYEKWSKTGAIFSFIELTALGDISEAFMIGDAKREYVEKRAVITKFREQHLQDEVTVFKNIPPIKVYHLVLNVD